MGTCVSNSEVGARGVLNVPNSGPPVDELSKPTQNIFVELLLINRILILNVNVNDANNSSLKESPHLSHLSDQQHNILSLLSSHGIYKYLQKYHQDSHCSIIDQIFQNTILKNFKNEYTYHITINTQQHTQRRQKKHPTCLTKLLNQNDLMAQIFQYLTLKNLINCSMVSFIWLFHSFNINSLYQLNLFSIIKWEADHDDDEHGQFEDTHLPLRVWQRFINTRQIIYKNSDSNINGDDGFQVLQPSKYFLKYFKLLQKIENVTCQFEQIQMGDITFLKVLSTQCNSIKFFCAKLGVFHEYVPHWRTVIIAEDAEIPRLELLNATAVSLEHVQVPVVLSNKCETLEFGNIVLNTSMCDRLIQDSDVTGVKNVSLCNIKFAVEDKHKYCQLLAEKLINIEKITIKGAKYDTLLLWEELAPTIEQNHCGGKKNNGDTPQLHLCNTNVSFNVGYVEDAAQQRQTVECYIKMIDFIVDNKIGLSLAQISLNNESYDIATKFFEKPEICQSVEKLKLQSSSTDSDHKNWIQFCHDYFDVHMNPSLAPELQVSVIENIKFNNLKCLSFDFTLGVPEDWFKIGYMLRCKLNYNYNNYSRKNNDHDQVFWKLSLKMRWPQVDAYNERNMKLIFEHLKGIWSNVNLLFIESGKPIEINVSFYRYYWGSDLSFKEIVEAHKQEDQMTKVYNLYGKKMFFNEFGDLAFEKGIEKPKSKSSLSKSKLKNQVPQGNKYYKWLEIPSIWCKFYIQSLENGGNKCAIDFCVKNVDCDNL